MDNQQERSVLSPEFLAGLIVGEGSYGLYIARSKNHIEIRPGFTLRMNDLETIDLMCVSFTALGLPFYRVQKLDRGCATVNATGIKRVRRHLDLFLPLLTGKKKEAASIVDEFIRRHWEKKPLYDEHDVRLIERLRETNGPNARRVPLEILRDYIAETLPYELRRKGKR